MGEPSALAIVLLILNAFPDVNTDGVKEFVIECLIPEAIPAQTCIQFMSRYESCFTILAKNRDGLGCVQKAQILGRNPGNHNAMGQATSQ